MKRNKIQIDNINVMWDNILIKPLDYEEVMEEDDVIKPDQYEDKPEFGLVLKVGTGRLLDSGSSLQPAVKVGELIIFNKYSTTKIRINKQDYLFIREEDILGNHPWN